MSENTILHEPYSYDFIGGKNNSFIFRTDTGIQYEIKFVPSGYLFEEGHPARDFTFEYIIAVLENNTGKTPPLDRRIPLTLALIFQDFFQEHRNVGVYICDSSDDKQAIRFRKFNIWFYHFKGTLFNKLDFPVKDKDDTFIYTSLIMRNDNPNYQVVVDGYLQLIQNTGQDK
jgi:hypothetical protein